MIFDSFAFFRFNLLFFLHLYFFVLRRLSFFLYLLFDLWLDLLFFHFFVLILFDLIFGFLHSLLSLFFPLRILNLFDSSPLLNQISAFQHVSRYLMSQSISILSLFQMLFTDIIMRLPQAIGSLVFSAFIMKTLTTSNAIITF